MKPVLLDAYCGEGGAGWGYDVAGFTVVGVDIDRQPRYPFEFHQGDAIELIERWGREFDYIHASPPCQAHSAMRRITGGTYPDLVARTRVALNDSRIPYVMENVEGAPLQDYVTLCGTMFGMRFRRHRRFEMRPVLPLLTPACSCKNGVAEGRLIGHRLRGPKPPGRRVPPVFTESEKRSALGVEWMTIAGMQEAIPPAYTEWLGRHMLSYLGVPVET